MKRFFGFFFKTLGVLVFIPLIALIGFTFFGSHKSLNIQPNSVLTLDLSSPIMETSSSSGIQKILTGPTLSFFDTLRGISSAQADPHIQAIALYVETPTLGLAQMDEIRNALLAFKKSGKKIYAYATSLGDFHPGTRSYYMASVADQIWMQPYSNFNITGFHIDQPFFGEILETLSIKPQIFARTIYKNAYASMTDSKASDPQIEAMNTLLGQFHETIFNNIEAARELEKGLLHRLSAESPMMSDTKAKEMGIIDYLGHKDQFIAAILDPNPSLSLEKNQKKSLYNHPRLISMKKYASEIKYLLNKKNHPEKIAIIYGNGVIMPKDSNSPFTMGPSDTMGANTIQQQFDEVLSNPSIKAIVFRLDTPGGSATASETIRRSVIIAKEKGVPVIASFGNVSASGGYWIAASCDKILASPLTITGSIGVLAGKVVFNEALSMFNINTSSFSAGENGSMWSPLTPYTEKQMELINTSMDLFYERFIELVSKGRNLSLDHVSEIAKGRVWSGVDALNFGLVDEYGGLNKALKVAAKLGGIAQNKPITVLEYPQEKNLVDTVEDLISGETQMISDPMQSLWQIFQRIILSLQLMTSSEVQIRETQIVNVR